MHDEAFTAYLTASAVIGTLGFLIFIPALRLFWKQARKNPRYGLGDLLFATTATAATMSVARYFGLSYHGLIVMAAPLLTLNLFFFLAVKCFVEEWIYISTRTVREWPDEVGPVTPPPKPPPQGEVAVVESDAPRP